MRSPSFVTKHVAVGAFLTLSLVAIATSADEGSSSTVRLRLDGIDAGRVRATFAGEGSARVLTIATPEPLPPLFSLVQPLLEGGACGAGKAMKKNAIVLSTDAVIQRTSDALLSSVRFPSYAGGPSELALTFSAPTTSTSPSLRVATDRAQNGGKKLASFRLSVGELPATEATRLDALLLKLKDGCFAPSPLVFDVPSKDAPVWSAWARKARATDAAVEYVGSLGETTFGVKLGGCTASAIKLDGPVTHVTMTCTRTRR